jgi:hypothetical protein
MKNVNKDQKNKYFIDGKYFSSKKEAGVYIREEILKKADFCKSLKNKNEKIFLKLLKVLEQHPEKSSVIKDVVDIDITPNSAKAYHIEIILKGGNREGISWIDCIRSVEDIKNNIIKDTTMNDLTDAMRNAVNDQIYNFKLSNPNKCCEICSVTESQSPKTEFHVDHHEKLFVTLKKDFLNQCNGHPTEFKKEGHFTVFRDEDNIFKTKWQEYHKNNATLRWLCAPCNLSRSKTQQ